MPEGVPIQPGSDDRHLLVYRTEKGRLVPVHLLVGNFDDNEEPDLISSLNPFPMGMIDLDASRGRERSDASGRIRTSQQSALFGSKMVVGKAPLFWDEQIVNNSGNATSTHVPSDAAAVMHVEANDSIIRQTYQRFAYESGKTGLIMFTGLFGTGVADVRKRVGYFNGVDGLFFEQDGLVNRVGELKNGVATLVDQADWNIDKLDGTGPSGISLLATAIQTFVIDFAWGGGQVRYGILVGGRVLYLHATAHANVAAGVFMRSPNLPLRWEIVSTGGTNEIQQVANSLIIEGDENSSAIQRWASQPAYVNANDTDNIYAVLGIRLAVFDVIVDALALDLYAQSNDGYEWLVLLNPTVAGPAPAWTLQPDSAVEIGFYENDDDNNHSTNLVTAVGTQLEGGFVSQQLRETRELVLNARRLGASIAGVADELVLAVRPIHTGLDVHGGWSWTERL